MSLVRPLLILVLTAAPLLAPAEAQHRREQDAARDLYKAGQVKSLREIEASVLPHMRGADYLGPEFDAASSTYRLKFMRSGAVIWVDVDGRTGKVIGHSGE
jgi:hypothetical protein